MIYFASRMSYMYCAYSNSSRETWRVHRLARSDCYDALAGLDLCWSQMLLFLQSAVQMSAESYWYTGITQAGLNFCKDVHVYCFSIVRDVVIIYFASGAGDQGSIQGLDIC